MVAMIDRPFVRATLKGCRLHPDRLRPPVSLRHAEFAAGRRRAGR